MNQTSSCLIYLSNFTSDLPGSHSLQSSHSGFLLVSHPCQVYPHLRAFLTAFPLSGWLSSQMAISFSPVRSYSNVTLPGLPYLKLPPSQSFFPLFCFSFPAVPYPHLKLTCLFMLLLSAFLQLTVNSLRPGSLFALLMNPERY